MSDNLAQSIADEIAQGVTEHDHDNMLRHLVDEWGMAGVVHKLFEGMNDEQVDDVVRAGRRQSDTEGVPTEAVE